MNYLVKNVQTNEFMVYYSVKSLNEGDVFSIGGPKVIVVKAGIRSLTDKQAITIM